MTENYTEVDIAVVRADRYSRDFPALQSYRNNVALPATQLASIWPVTRPTWTR